AGRSLRLAVVGRRVVVRICLDWLDGQQVWIAQPDTGVAGHVGDELTVGGTDFRFAVQPVEVGYHLGDIPGRQSHSQRFDEFPGDLPELGQGQTPCRRGELGLLGGLGRYRRAVGILADIRRTLWLVLLGRAVLCVTGQERSEIDLTQVQVEVLNDRCRLDVL